MNFKYDGRRSDLDDALCRWTPGMEGNTEAQQLQRLQKLLHLPHSRVELAGEIALLNGLNPQWMSAQMSLVVDTDRGGVLCGSILAAACVAGNLDLMRYLLEERPEEFTRGVEASIPMPNDKKKFLGGSPMCHAAAYGHIPLLEYLLDRGGAVDLSVDGKINCLNYLGTSVAVTPLLCALLAGQDEAAAWLLAHGADLQLQSLGLRFLERELGPENWQSICGRIDRLRGAGTA